MLLKMIKSGSRNTFDVLDDTFKVSKKIMDKLDGKNYARDGYKTDNWGIDDLDEDIDPDMYEDEDLEMAIEDPDEELPVAKKKTTKTKLEKLLKVVQNKVEKEAEDSKYALSVPMWTL